jgi:hypothetical protein
LRIGIEGIWTVMDSEMTNTLEGSLGWFISSGRDLVGRFSDDDFAYARLKYYF